MARVGQRARRQSRPGQRADSAWIRQREPRERADAAFAPVAVNGSQELGHGTVIAWCGGHEEDEPQAAEAIDRDPPQPVARARLRRRQDRPAAAGRLPRHLHHDPADHRHGDLQAVGATMAIADGADRARVLDVVAEIAAALEAGPRPYSLSPGHDLALADGEAGIALFLSELPAYQEAAARRIDRAIHGLEARGLDASLHFGFTGIAWAWQRVMARLGGTCDDSLAVVDDAVLELLGSSHGRRLSPGVLFGLAGLAIYALDRATPVADRCLAEIVELLHASAQPDGDGLRWWLAPPAGTAYVERFPD